MHRYDINFIMSMEFDDVMGMYLKAKRENAEDKLWDQWLVDFARMDQETFIPFEDYKKEAFKPKPEKLDIDKILAEAEKIKALDQKRR